MATNDSEKFYLGKVYDEQGNLTDEKLLYDPQDLVTHCMITGMTGSGKTGLGIILLEEMARKNIPAIVIDPKGDLTNLMLHFPELRAEDFEPWIDPEAPVREGKSLLEISVETAEAWKKGLSEWGLGKEEISELEKVSYTIFTPGSTVGNPINILSSFEAPKTPVKEGDEFIREEIATTVTALLDLIGISNIDPLQSREHILLSSIIEQYWNMGKSIDIEEMIAAVNDPPFEKLGALPVDKMYPPKDRFQLSLLLNNFLASPSFQNWNKGPNLDIEKLLYTNDGKARMNVFYLQHLNDHERMFFVTMLYSQIESWMREQPGTGNLKLGVYFDEIAGYLPATSNPASRNVIIRLLKQARAFGVGMILSSQNPIDFDYKALSNAGTWFIGHLQTAQDVRRLIDGLATNDGGIDQTEAKRRISALKNRQFLYMNVHTPGLKVMTTRWTLNYLAGPLTRNRIPLLIEKGLSERVDTVSSVMNVNETVAELADTSQNQGEDQGEAEMSEEKAKEVQPEGTKPEIAANINEYYRRAEKIAAEVGAPAEEITYIPVWIAQAEARILQPKYNLDFIDKKAVLIDEPDIRGVSINWREYETEPFDEKTVQSRPQYADAKYEQPPEWMSDSGSVRRRESDFLDYIYREGIVKIRANKPLDVYAAPDVTEEDFIAMCKGKVAEASQNEKDKLAKAYENIVDRMETKIRKAEADVADKTDKVKSKNIEKYGAFGELVIGMFTGRKRSVSTSINKYGQSTNADNALEKAQLVLDELKADLEQQTEEFKKQIAEVEEKWNKIAEEMDEVTVTPMKKDIFIDYFGILWLPYYTDENGKFVKAF